MVAMAQRKPTVPRDRGIIQLVEWRCPNCRTLLCRMGLSPVSVVEIKCPRCNAFIVKRVDR